MKFKNAKQRKAVMASIKEASTNLFPNYYKYERCVKKVKKQSGYNPYAVCKSSVLKNEDNKSFNTTQISSFRDKLDRGRTLHFQSKEARDSVYRELKDRVKLRRSTSTGSILHPEYVADYKGKIETGIGNTQYKTMFPKLYNLQMKR